MRICLIIKTSTIFAETYVNHKLKKWTRWKL